MVKPNLSGLDLWYLAKTVQERYEFKLMNSCETYVAKKKFAPPYDAFEMRVSYSRYDGFEYDLYYGERRLDYKTSTGVAPVRNYNNVAVRWIDIILRYHELEMGAC